MPVRKYGSRKSKNKHNRARRTHDNKKHYMWNPVIPERQDSVLREAYKKDERRPWKEREKDCEEPNPRGKTFRRADIKQDQDKLEKWLKHPREYDIIGVDSQEPRPFKPRPGQKLYHGTNTDIMLLILKTKKLGPPVRARYARFKSSGLTTNEKIARDWVLSERFNEPDKTRAYIVFNGEALSKKNKLVKIKYDTNWFEEHPEYARRIKGREEFQNEDELFKEARNQKQEQEIIARRPIRFKISDIQEIHVQNRKAFINQLKKVIPEKEWKALAPRIHELRD